MSPKQRGASLNPEDFSKGGILNDEDVEFLKARFFKGEDAVEQTEGLAKYKDYEENLFLGALLKITSGESKGEEDWQYWSSGKLIYFEPSEDGKLAVPAPDSSSEKLSDNCNAYAFLASLVNAGYPRDRFDDDVAELLEGMLAHVIRVDQVKRPGLDSDGRPKTVLTVEKIHDDSPVGLPEGSKKRKARGRAKPVAVETADTDTDLEEISATTVVKILIDADGGPIKKTSLFSKMLKLLQKDYPDDYKDIIKIAADDKWLSASDDFSFDGKELEIVD